MEAFFSKELVMSRCQHSAAGIGMNAPEAKSIL
jgi:hypothetical protein